MFSNVWLTFKFVVDYLISGVFCGYILYRRVPWYDYITRAPFSSCFGSRSDLGDKTAAIGNCSGLRPSVVTRWKLQKTVV